MRFKSARRAGKRIQRIKACQSDHSTREGYRIDHLEHHHKAYTGKLSDQMQPTQVFER